MAQTLALLAACCFALGTVLQQKGTLAVPLPADDPGFFPRLLRTPVCLAGAALQALGCVLQAFALNRGPLVVVQPIVMSSLVIALPFGARLTGQAVGRREVLAACTTVAGLAVFVAVSDPEAGSQTGSTRAWIIATLVTAALVGAPVIMARRRPPTTAAALLGAAAGICFGYQAAVTKVLVGHVGEGLAAVLHSPSLYALAVSAPLGFVVQQSALKTGLLAPALAATNVAELVVSVALGALVFEEALSRGHGRLAVSIAALVVAACGVLALTRAQEPPGEDDATAAR